MGKVEMRRIALALVPALLLVAGCTNSGTAPASSTSAAAPTPTVSEALVVMDPPDGAVDIAPDATITVRAEQGTLEKVVLSGGAAVPGTLSPDRTTWTATGLFAGTRYVLSARAE
ncbi:MAG TPA: Ig-like domain-containing protein, partial [Jiangellaceae bacterium]